MLPVCLGCREAPPLPGSDAAPPAVTAREPDKERCGELKQSYRNLQAERAVCKTEKDCTCFGVCLGGFDGWGATSPSIKTSMDDVLRQANSLGCGTPARCGAWHCVPGCIDGVCKAKPH